MINLVLENGIVFAVYIHGNQKVGEITPIGDRRYAVKCYLDGHDEIVNTVDRAYLVIRERI